MRSAVRVSPGLIPVLKHQAGKHEQKLHGSWSDGPSDLPDGWTQKSEESRIQEFIARKRAEGNRDTDERLTKVYSKAFVDTDEYAGTNNTRVLVSRDAQVTTDDLNTQLKTVADLQRIAPVQDLRVEIDDRAFRFAQLDDGVGGFVVQGDQTIYLRPSSVIDGLDLSKGNLMPVLDKKTYALVHEYGHVLDQRSDSTSSSDKANVLTQAQTGMSRYASGEEPSGAAGREAFAEAWTGWVGSQGRLAEPFRSQQSFVGYYAEKYGWDAGGEGRAPSAGVAKQQGRMILADTFTEEGSVVQFVPESTLIRFAPGLVPVLKHAMHDQKTHGSWATGQKGGSGLSHREMYNLKLNRPDPLVKKVYDAEEKNHNQVQNKNIEKPFAPARSQFEEYSEYDAAYKKYSKDFLDWSKTVTTAVISPTGEKHLDGTPRGVTGYVRDVLSQDWFVEQFGNGGSAGNPEVKVTSNFEAAGSYKIGFKNNKPVSVLSVERGYSKAEPNLVHEIAHYATTISATSPHDGHGVEFARNHIFIAGKVMGESFANQLENSYREVGIPLGD